MKSIEVKTERLAHGLTVKNYKSMCELLGEIEATGTAKKSQLREWERYFDFEKDGQKFIIQEIYDKPKPQLSNALYVKLIERILMSELSTKEGHTFNYTKTQLYKMLGMANSDYKRTQDVEDVEDLSEYSKWNVDDFYQRTNQKLSDIVMSAMNSMRRRSLLEYYRIHVIVEGYEQRKATNDEVKTILRVQRNVLDGMNEPKIPFHRIKEYYQKVNTRLKEDCGWDYVYAEYQLIFNSDQILNCIPTVQKELDAEIEANRTALNDIVVDKMVKQIDKVLAKGQKIYEAEVQAIEDNPDIKFLQKKWYIKNLFQYPSDYKQQQMELIVKLLKLR